MTTETMKKQKGIEELQEKYSKLNESMKNRIREKVFAKAPEEARNPVEEVDYSEIDNEDFHLVEGSNNGIVKKFGSMEDSDERLVVADYLHNKGFVSFHKLLPFEEGLGGYRKNATDCYTCSKGEEIVNDLGLEGYVTSLGKSDSFYDRETEGITKETMEGAYSRLSEKLLGEHSKKIKKALEQKINEKRSTK